MISDDRRYRLPGSRMAVSTVGDWARAMVGASWYLGPWGWRLLHAARRGRRKKLHALERQWAEAVRGFLRIRLRIDGWDHVDPSESYVVTPLHEGFADVLALLTLPLDLRFVARDELFEWPTLGRYLRDSSQIVVPTSGGRTAYRELLRRSASIFAAGESLVLYPQGGILGIESAFWPGAFRLAANFNRPVLPVVLTGSHRVWEYPYSPLLRFGQTMTMQVLEPITPTEAVGEAGDLEREMKRLALASSVPPRRFDPEVDGYWDDYHYEIDPDFPQVAELVARHRAGRS